MTISRTARYVARETYRHACYTGRYTLRVGEYNGHYHPEGGYVAVYGPGPRTVVQVPVAKSWL